MWRSEQNRCVAQLVSQFFDFPRSFLIHYRGNVFFMLCVVKVRRDARSAV
jgi:hypothetical protein